MRKQYETEESLSVEKEIAQQVCNQWGVSMRKLPKYYSADYFILANDKPRAFCEIKSRSYPHSKFNSYQISLKKYMALRELTRETGLSSIIIVRFGDGSLFYHVVDTEDNVPIVYGGRTDREDWQDVEPLALLDINSFKFI